MFPLNLVLPGISSLIAFSMGCYNYKYIPASVRLLILECLLSISSDCLFNNDRFLKLALINLFVFFNFHLVVLSTKSLLPKNIRFYFYAISIPIFYIVFYFRIYFFGIYIMAVPALISSSLIIIFLMMLVLYFNEISSKNASPLPIRLLCFSLIVYHCGTFPLFSQWQSLIDAHLPVKFININVVLDSLKYLVLGASFIAFRVTKQRARINSVLHG